jgi:pimeloyl-ACP methyl ester carboxylesterase
VKAESVMVGSPFGDTHVLVAGAADAPPLVLFHGVGDDAAVMWLYHIKDLSARHRCYAVDTLGGPGRSLWLLGANDLLADVPKSEERLRALGLRYQIIPDAWHTVNHNQPELVDRLILGSLEAGTP